MRATAIVAGDATGAPVTIPAAGGEVFTEARERFADPAKEAAERLTRAGQDAPSALAALLLSLNETAQRTHNANGRHPR